MGVTLNSVSSTRRHAGAEYSLLDSGAQLHACPTNYPGQQVPLPDPGIHTASGARLQHDGGRLVTYKLAEGRPIRVLFHACAVQKPILSLGCLAQQVHWSDLLADTGTLFFPDKTQTKRSHTQLREEKRQELAKHWQCNTEAQDLEGTPWRNEEPRSSEEGAAAADRREPAESGEE